MSDSLNSLQDEAIREILKIVEDATVNNRIVSYHELGIELKKAGVSTTKTRTKEWNRLKTKGE